MLAKLPPMGFNTWNTFGPDINEKMVLEMADAIVEKGYRDAGYEYVVIDDCWSLRERDENGLLVADPEKFPHGMKYVADYVHSKGLKFGMYSCAGIRTCAGYPSSYDHEYADAKTFASWGVDFLKYDFCNFPSHANCKQRYLTMAMALRSCGRDILFSACNWGVEQPWNWMREIGAHMYRSTGDIIDTFDSTASIIRQQMDKFNSNASGCFNDIDMLTVGMYGKGLVGGGENCNKYNEYELEFSFWCYFGAPLMMGGDLRTLDSQCHDLLVNKELIAINQDEECRPPHKIREMGDVHIFVRHLSGNRVCIGIFNLAPDARFTEIIFDEMGIPYASGVALKLKDVISREDLGVVRDDYITTLEGHTCKLLVGEFVNI